MKVGVVSETITAQFSATRCCAPTTCPPPWAASTSSGLPDHLNALLPRALPLPGVGVNAGPADAASYGAPHVQPSGFEHHHRMPG